MVASVLRTLASGLESLVRKTLRVFVLVRLAQQQLEEWLCDNKVSILRSSKQNKVANLPKISTGNKETE